MTLFSEYCGNIILSYKIPNHSGIRMASVGGQAADGVRAQRLAKEREQGKEETDFTKKKLAAGLPFANKIPFVHNFIRIQGLPCLMSMLSTDFRNYYY